MLSSAVSDQYGVEGGSILLSVGTSEEEHFVFAEAAIKAMKEKDIFSWFILESKDDVYAEYPYKTIARFFHDAECGEIETLDWKDPIRLEYFAN